MATNNNIASVRTAAALGWGTGISLAINHWLEGISETELLFIVAGATLIVNRIGTELQQTRNRFARLVGDILLWVDKVPVYESPPAPDAPNP